MKRELLAGFLVLLVIFGCTTGTVASNKGKLERWTTFNGDTLRDAAIGNKQSRVVFLREDEAILGPAVNIFIDGDYLTSLLGGGYRSAVICSHGEKILSSFSRSDRFADRDSGIDYNFVTGGTAYIKVVSNEDGLPVFQRISSEEGQSLIGGLRHETQTLPRIKSNELCDKAVLEKTTIQVHTLFNFDKSDYQNMLPKGREEINQLGRKYKNKELGLTGVKVIGYTDPEGDVAYNLALSKRRAKTVKEALQNAGVDVPIEMEMLGKSNLLKRNCTQKFKHDKVARVKCDQPNRRVEVILYKEKQA